mmetsp:Transcript_42224/g.136499  ORF Transcript_42224/g.136499 Transcript_42224/m.136499 type:complete len:205 (+) Transcript_42224:81-695(+)
MAQVFFGRQQSWAPAPRHGPRPARAARRTSAAAGWLRRRCRRWGRGPCSGMAGRRSARPGPLRRGGAAPRGAHGPRPRPPLLGEAAPSRDFGPGGRALGGGCPRPRPGEGGRRRWQRSRPGLRAPLPGRRRWGGPAPLRAGPCRALPGRRRLALVGDGAAGAGCDKASASGEDIGANTCEARRTHQRRRRCARAVFRSLHDLGG